MHRSSEAIKVENRGILKEGRVEEEAAKEAAEQSISKMRGQTLKTAPLPAPFVDTLSTVTCRLHAQRHQIQMGGHLCFPQITPVLPLHKFFYSDLNEPASKRA